MIPAPDEIYVNGQIVANHLRPREKEIWMVGKLAGEAEYREALRARIQVLRDRPITSFDGYTGRDALDQVLALLNQVRP